MLARLTATKMKCVLVCECVFSLGRQLPAGTRAGRQAQAGPTLRSDLRQVLLCLLSVWVISLFSEWFAFVCVCQCHQRGSLFK